MSGIHTDQRSIKARREPAAEQCVAEGLARLREVQIEIARAFARVDASVSFVYEGCASVVEWGRKLGYSAAEVRTLTHLGKTLDALPEAEESLRSGALAVESAAQIGRIYANPRNLRPGDDWLEIATTESERGLRRLIRQRLEAEAQGEPGVTELTVVVRTKTRDDFERARDVASQKAGRSLSEGQAFSRIVTDYLDRHDPLRKRVGTRRLGPTADLPGSRYVPAAVVAAVWKRAGGRCEVPGCNRRHGLELAHRTPHAKGSGREVDDMGLQCRRHHILYDAGRIPWPVPPRSARNGASTVREGGVGFRPSRRGGRAWVARGACGPPAPRNAPWGRVDIDPAHGDRRATCASSGRSILLHPRAGAARGTGPGCPRGPRPRSAGTRRTPG